MHLVALTGHSQKERGSSAGMYNVGVLPISKDSERRVVGFVNLYAKYIKAQVKEKKCHS